MWRLQGTGAETPGFDYEGTATDDRTGESFRFWLGLRGTRLVLEVDSSRPSALQFVECLVELLGRPTSGPEILGRGQLSDSDGELPTYAVWELPPGEGLSVGEILRRAFY